VLTSQDEGVTLEGQPKALFLLTLNEKPAAGYLWNLDELKAQGFAILRDTRVVSTHNEVGSPVVRHVAAYTENASRGEMSVSLTRPWLPSAPPAAERQFGPEPLPKPVARITGMVDCKLVQSPESGVQSPALDSRLSTLVSLGDKFALASGLMEISYDTGAKVILQGPATYEVDSAGGGYLSLGKLTARVEKLGHAPFRPAAAF